jgi:hypothetical protein
MLVTGTGLNRDAFEIVDGYWIPKSMITGRTSDGSYQTSNGQTIKDQP